MMYPDFETITQHLENGKLWDFPGGVHPDDKKALASESPIQTIPLPDKCYIPVKQHIGVEGHTLVAVGDKVLKGQPLTRSSHPFAVPVHAVTSGEITAIKEHVSAHPSGLPEIMIELTPDGLEQWTELSPLTDYQTQDKTKVIEAICDAGISGMGGAGFPTHIKTNARVDVEFLIINGVECEPYITSDDRLMREHAWQIRQGIDVLTHLVTPKCVIVAIEDNKPRALEAMRIACQGNDRIKVVCVPTKYPTGGEKQLIQVLTNREVPRNALPADVGVLMFNVGTCYAIADAIFHGKPLIQRVVTITGEAVKTPMNAWVLLGTPVSHPLSIAEYLPKKQYQPRIVMGGPMMGFSLSTMQVPVVKTTNCLLAPGKKELADGDNERPCIRCSACADACPVSLLPQQMFWHAKAKELDKAEDYNLFDCIECGACAYVCPSEIPLVHYYRQAKAEIKIQRDEKNKAEKAKARFEARKERLEKEKQAREEKHRKAKEARSASAAKKATSASAPAVEQTNDVAPKDKVAAALARAKAKKAQLAASTNSPDNTPENTEPAPVKAADEGNDNKARVAAAIARAKAKKAAQQQASALESAPVLEQSENEKVSDDAEAKKKARVAAAVARAKAKKAAQQAAQSDSSVTEDKAEKTDNPDTNSNDTVSAPSTSVEDDAEAKKKARIAAAVARAKAKKAAQQAAQQAEKPDAPKAEGEAKQNDKPEAESHDAASAPSATVEDDAEAKKKARIAAAVAKAKAKKLARENNEENS